ncbi:hypothetical protein T4B_1749 [Trichinella pseudospiralis]|uniref:Uncharacterized protein n=1 Tax=Trichinella pseudospiralis TaxID=6337 RepID=A0A0V1H0U7_TRIPS|nr:hypothetical protein T4B_1749 [Trichinella pseudospiralis]KRZ40561.1 hypothetical protein T4C_6371 [Trichinella pseudospiralis]
MLYLQSICRLANSSRIFSAGFPCSKVGKKEIRSEIVRLDHTRSPTPGDESTEGGQETDCRHVHHHFQVHRSRHHAREQADAHFLQRLLFILHVQRTGKVQPHSVEWEGWSRSFRRKVAHHRTKRASVELPACDAGSDASFDRLTASDHPKATSQGCQGLVQPGV